MNKIINVLCVISLLLTVITPAPAQASTKGSIRNVALGREVTGWPHYFTYAPSHDVLTTWADLQNLTDGNVNSYARHRTPISGDKPCMRIDLSNVYDVVSIEYVTHTAANINSDNTGVIIAASQEYLPLEQMDTIKRLTSSDLNPPDNTIRIELPQGTKYRYFALYKETLATFYCYEFRVFAYADDIYGGWDVTLNGNKTDSITETGIYEFSIDYENYLDDYSNSMLLIVSSYDAAGNMLHYECAQQTSTGKYKSQIYADSETKRLKASLVLSNDDLSMVVDCKEIVVPGTSSQELDDKADLLDLTFGDDSFEIKAGVKTQREAEDSEGFTISSSDRINVALFDPNSTSNNAFANVNQMKLLYDASEPINISGKNINLEKSANQSSISNTGRDAYDNSSGTVAKLSSGAMAAYDINVVAAGDYSFILRACGADSSAQSTIDVFFDDYSGDALETLEVPYAYNFNLAESFTDISLTNSVFLSPGLHTLYVSVPQGDLYFSSITLSTDAKLEYTIPGGDYIGGFGGDVASISLDEVLEYSVNVAAEGDYELIICGNSETPDSLIGAYTATTPIRTIAFPSVGTQLEISMGTIHLTEGANSIFLTCLNSSSSSLGGDLKYFFPITGLIAGKDFSFNFQAPPLMDHGKYPARITKTDIHGNTEIITFDFYYNDAEALAECVNSFATVTPEEFANCFNEYVYENALINIGAIEELNNIQLINRLGKYFAFMREIYTKEDYLNTPFSTTYDVLECLKGAILLEGLNGKNVEYITKTHNKYAYILSDLLPGVFNPVKFISSYEMVNKETAEYSVFFHNIKKAAVFSCMQGETNGRVASILEEYSAFLNIDMAYLKSNNIDIIEIVNKMNKENVNQYIVNPGKEFSDIAKSIVTEKSKSEPSHVSKGGAVKSSSGSGTVSPAPKSGPTAPPEEEKPTQTQRVNPFNDISEYVWAYDSILDLAQLNVITVGEDKEFRPSELITREEFTKMVVTAFDMSFPVAEMKFEDCKPEDWWFPYVRTAFSGGIIKGMNEKQFGIGETITRQDTAVILERVLESLKKSLKRFDEGIFSDNDNIDDYAKRAVAIAAYLEIVTGFEDGSFKPKEGLTRAQAAVIVCRTLKYTGNREV